MLKLTVLHKVYGRMKRWLPTRLALLLRSTVTAFLTPVFMSYRTGHFISSFKMKAVSRTGCPLPWYTYSLIEFLAQRKYVEKSILEFGGGQSTLWWAARAKSVYTLEGDRDWFEKIRQQMPRNVFMEYVTIETAEKNRIDVRGKIAQFDQTSFDVIVIDGLIREEMIPIAIELVASDGIIICDNSEGYDFVDGFKNSGMMRADFYGYAAGVILPHCSSIYFRPNSFVFSPAHPITISSSLG